MPGVEDRVAVVTGAGRGLGRRYALLLAERGAKVVVNDLGADVDGTGARSELADSVADEIRRAGGTAVANADTVATSAGGRAIIDTALEAFGRVDVVVNNAGILRDVTFHKMTDEQWDAVLKVHLYGAYNVTHAAWPHLREQGYGRVIVATSTTGLYGNLGQANYGAAKLGLVGLIHTLAFEGRRYGITANAVCPLAATRMTADVMPDEELAQLDPAYVAPVVVHLASEECTDTDEIILAAGGRYARVVLMEAQGVDFDRVPTVEDLAAKWSDIMDLSEPRLGSNPLA